MVFVPVIIALGLLIAAGVFRLGSKSLGESKIYFVMLPIPLLLLWRSLPVAGADLILVRS